MKSLKGKKNTKMQFKFTGEFVLKPAHTPTDDISEEPPVLNFGSQEQFGSYDRRNIPPKKPCI